MWNDKALLSESNMRNEKFSLEDDNLEKRIKVVICPETLIYDCRIFSFHREIIFQ